MMVTIQNMTEHFEPKMGARGIEVPNSTEEHLLIASAVPDRKRRKIIESALAQADLSDDVVFVGAYEALSGFCTVVGGDQ